MKKQWILACIAGGLAGMFAGCDSSAGGGSSSNSSPIVAGRAAFDSAGVQVVDSSGAVVAHGKVGQGVFHIGLPEGVRFPILLTADSAGIKLRVLVPGADLGRVEVVIDELTDSAAKSLGAYVRPPHGIGPDALKGPLGQAKARLDSACKADSTKCPRRPVPPMHDSACRADSTLCPPRPVPPVRDSLRPVPPVRDSACLADSTLCPPRPVPPVRDSLRPVPPAPPVDSLRPVPPVPPVRDSLRPVPPAPPADSLRPVPPVPPVDSVVM